MAASGIAAGILLRSINKAGRVWGAGFSPKVIWGVVKEKAKICEIPALAPHDLRRYAESRIMPSFSAVRACLKEEPVTRFGIIGVVGKR
jgi:hypothetical protein